MTKMLLILQKGLLVLLIASSFCLPSHSLPLDPDFNGEAAKDDDLSNASLSGSRSTDKLALYWIKPQKMKKTLLKTKSVGNTAQFKCLAGGEDPITVKWFHEKKSEEARNDTKGLLELRPLKFRHKHQILELKAVVPNDGGLYTCVVSNKHGSIEYTYELEIKEGVQIKHVQAVKPVIGPIMNQTVEVGSDVVFQCKVLSDIHPHVQWLRVFLGIKNQTTGRQENEYEVLKKSGINTTNADLQTLMLKNVSYNDSGEYSCLAGNRIGYSYKSAWLQVVPQWNPQ